MAESSAASAQAKRKRAARLQGLVAPRVPLARYSSPLGLEHARRHLRLFAHSSPQAASPVSAMRAGGRRPRLRTRCSTLCPQGARRAGGLLATC
ncbi:hypothetical protein ACP70R_032561 [Stipagrostis hirtigluma subsp. patula]